MQINLRLSTLYAKVERWADAARATTIAKEVYAEFGHPEQSQQYAELAEMYLKNAPAAADTAESSSVNLLSLSTPAAAPGTAPEPTVSGFGFESQANSPSVGEFSMEVPTPAKQTPASSDGAHEINMDEWESMLSVETPPQPEWLWCQESDAEGV